MKTFLTLSLQDPSFRVMVHRCHLVLIISVCIGLLAACDSSSSSGPAPATQPSRDTRLEQTPTTPQASPTAAPTAAPTAEPTPRPSPQPTAYPTPEPLAMDQGIEVTGEWHVELDFDFDGLGLWPYLPQDLPNPIGDIAPGQKLLLADDIDKEQLGISSCASEDPQSVFLERPGHIDQFLDYGSWYIKGLEEFGYLDLSVGMTISNANHINVLFSSWGYDIASTLTRLQTPTRIRRGTSELDRSLRPQEVACNLVNGDTTQARYQVLITYYDGDRFVYLTLNDVNLSVAPQQLDSDQVMVSYSSDHEDDEPVSGALVTVQDSGTSRVTLFYQLDTLSTAIEHFGEVIISDFPR